MALTAKRITKTRKVLLCLMVALAIVLCVVLWRGIERDAMPDAVVPMPIMPAPNARDDYDRAAALLTRVPEIEDAVLAMPTEPTDAPFPKLAHFEALVRQNAAALAAMRKGFGHEFYALPARAREDYVPACAGYRNLARLLNIQTTVRAARERWAAAMASGLDGIQLGVSTVRGGNLQVGLVGKVCEGITRRKLYGIVPRLSARDARQAARRLEGILAKRVPYADILQEEKWSVQAIMLAQMRRPNWRGEVMAAREVDARVFQRMSKRSIFDSYTRYMDALIATAYRPYTPTPALPAPPTDPLGTPYLFHFPGRWCAATSNAAYSELLLVQLALQAYQQEHGAYPANLTALVPGYLQALPTDPFPRVGAFKYQVTKTGYRLYSLGPDDKDDGGKPCTEGQVNSGSLQPESVGDLVAGVNIQ